MKDLHNVQVYIVNLRIQKARITHKYLLEISFNNQNRLSHLNTCHNRILESVTNCCFAGMRWNAPCDWIRVASEKRTVWISEYTCQSSRKSEYTCQSSRKSQKVEIKQVEIKKMLRKTENDPELILKKSGWEVRECLLHYRKSVERKLSSKI